MFYVFDIDGTLANAEHRLYHIQTEPKDWVAFYSACYQDAPIDVIIEIMRVLVKQGHRVELWTGRSDDTEQQTRAWCHRFDVPNVPMRMRREGDHRVDTEVKAEWLVDGHPDMIFEDRKSMVQMWRGHGIRVAHIAEGDY